MESLDAFLEAAPTRSLYEILGVPPTAGAPALKKAYRRLCLWCHPDKNPHARAAEAFLLVCAAFEVLSDPAGRRAHDAGRAPIQRPAYPGAAETRAAREAYEMPRATPGTFDPFRDWPAAGRAASTRRPRSARAADTRRPRSAPAARPAPARSTGVDAARRRSRDAARAARAQREAMEREARSRREVNDARRSAGRDDAEHARTTARRRAAATAQKRAAAARKQYEAASAKNEAAARDESAARHQAAVRVKVQAAAEAPARAVARTPAEAEDAAWRRVMRDLTAPENSRRRAAAHETLRKELDRHKAEWDRFERAFQNTDAARVLPALHRDPCVDGSHAAGDFWEEPRVRATAETDVDVEALQRGGPFIVRHRTRPRDLYAWVSHDAMRLQWRALDMGAADGAPSGFLAMDAVEGLQVKHRKGVPVLVLRDPERKLFLELAPESDVTAATWAATLAHLVRLAMAPACT